MNTTLKRRGLTFVATLGLLISAPAGVFAQQEGEETLASLFDEATAAYSEQDFGKASTLYQKAYEREPHAIFLYNAARATHSAGNTRSALGLLTRAIDPEIEQEPLPEELEEKALAFEKELREALVAEEEKKKEEERKEEELRQAKLEALAKQSEDDATRLSRVGHIGIGTMGVGAIGLLGAGVMNNRARKTITAMAPPHASREEYDTLAGELASQQRVGKIALYTGGAISLLGASVLAYDLMTIEQPAQHTPAQPEETSTLTPKLRVNLGFRHVGVEVSF